MPKRVLLADDSVTVRKVVELAFSDTEIRLDAVGSGAEAMRRIRELQPDLILADVAMPAPTGYEICLHVKTSERPVPVLLLAGAFEPFDGGRAREVGADGWVRKPFESRSLLQKVEALLTRRTPPNRPEPARDSQASPPDLRSDEPVRVDVASEPPAASAPEPVKVTVHPDPGEPVAAKIESTRGEAPPTVSLTPEQIDAIAAAALERLSLEVVREIAWKVVPDLAETVLRERLRDLEREKGKRS
jgi:CheY-like chemotaxis protein